MRSADDVETLTFHRAVVARCMGAKAVVAIMATGYGFHYISVRSMDIAQTVKPCTGVVLHVFIVYIPYLSYIC